MAGSEPDEDESVLDIAEQSNRPMDTALRQQRIEAWNPYLDPWWVVTTLLILGAIFVPVGFKLQSMSDEIVELTIEYDGTKNAIAECAIDTANEDKVCVLTFTIPKDMEPPILIYYQLENFHQNHRDYVKSRDNFQLLGTVGSEQAALQARECDPMNIIGGIRLNPCGLIANTLFNDVITLLGDEFTMVEEGIAWQSDLEYMFAQPDGFNYAPCPDQNACDASCCEGDQWSCQTPYTEDGICYSYFYPEDNETQYLYETYPMVVSPLEGVTNEHFIVWMRTATTTTFRNLYGYIEEPIAAGTNLTFQINNNYEVNRFKGQKSLIITNNNRFGGKNEYLGVMFYGIGFFCLGAGAFFGLKQMLRPRKIADPRYLHYKEE